MKVPANLRDIMDDREASKKFGKYIESVLCLKEDMVDYLSVF